MPMLNDDEQQKFLSEQAETISKAVKRTVRDVSLPDYIKEMLRKDVKLSEVQNMEESDEQIQKRRLTEIAAVYALMDCSISLAKMVGFSLDRVVEVFSSTMEKYGTKVMAATSRPCNDPNCDCNKRAEPKKH